MEVVEETEREVAGNAELADDPLGSKSDTFKKPQLCLVGPRKGKGTKVRVVDSPNEPKDKEGKDTIAETINVPIPPSGDPDASTSEGASKPAVKLSTEPEHRTSKPRSQGVPAQKLKEAPIPYLEPKWGGIPTENYSLDVIKSGTILEPLDLSTKSHYVFGRQTNCDVQMAHPTISRYHLVIQYSRGTAEKPQGFYLYDLGSTHGTFLNKNKVRPEMFIRLKVGYQIKLGASSRLYLLQGPSEDMEEESELTVTELKAKRQLELQERELAEIHRKQKEEEELKKKEEEQRKREEEGIDWGMGDDADEETDLSENPYAATTNEDLYIDDPKKTLRGWFEREGHELEYDVEEKGPGQFLCRIEVPVEGARGGCMVAEAMLKGKKKEVVAQCALEACRLLDRLGLLRQANHESRKRKAKNWEEEDFYDSDDDTFLDRTGAVEKKRQQRMHQAGKGEEQVETYQSLSEKHSNILKKLESTQLQLQKAQKDLAAAKAKAADEDGDSLDTFMSNLSSVGSTDKKLVNKFKLELVALNKEEVHLRKLVNIARPASLPELVAPVPVSEAISAKDSNALKNKLMSAVRKKANKNKEVPPSSSTNCNEGREAASSEEEEEEEIEVQQPHKRGQNSSDHNGDSTKDKPMPEQSNTIIGPARPAFLKDNAITLKSSEEIDKETDSIMKEERLQNNDDNINDDDDDQSAKEAEKRRKKNRRRLLQRNEKALERTKAEYDASDPNYSVWVPPENQTGDGKTKLNEKLGY